MGLCKGMPFIQKLSEWQIAAKIQRFHIKVAIKKSSYTQVISTILLVNSPYREDGKYVDSCQWKSTSVSKNLVRYGSDRHLLECLNNLVRRFSTDWSTLRTQKSCISWSLFRFQIVQLFFETIKLRNYYQVKMFFDKRFLQSLHILGKQFSNFRLHLWLMNKRGLNVRKMA